MLVITRKVGETINIGDNIKVTIRCVNGKQVRLGIDADPSIKIDREEIHMRKKL